MGKARIKKLFDLHARNLSTIKKHPLITYEPDIDDIFICPMCLKYFTRKCLEDKPIPLSEEHVPPKKLGGKIRTITCKNCNNQAGTKLESLLKKQLDFDDVISKKPGASYDIEYSVGNNTDLVLPANFSIGRSGEWIIAGHPHRTNPDDMKKLDDIMQDFSSHNSFNTTFTIPTDIRPNAALLRIAYLQAFSDLGYSFLINPHLAVIRTQIESPEKEILPKLAIIKRFNFPEKSLGVNIITAPEELKAFLVVFDLITNFKGRTRYGVILPAPTNYGLDVYNHLSSEGKIEAQIQVTNLPDRIGFTDDPFAALNCWNNLEK